jgi:hypothetical protein
VFPLFEPLPVCSRSGEKHALLFKAGILTGEVAETLQHPSVIEQSVERHPQGESHSSRQESSRKNTSHRMMVCRSLPVLLRGHPLVGVCPPTFAHASTRFALGLQITAGTFYMSKLKQTNYLNRGKKNCWRTSIISGNDLGPSSENFKEPYASFIIVFSLE